MLTHILKRDIRISFFKPATEMARLNRNIVVSLVIVWTVAIYRSNNPKWQPGFFAGYTKNQGAGKNISAGGIVGTINREGLVEDSKAVGNLRTLLGVFYFF
jgi:hypothetical protein